MGNWTYPEDPFQLAPLWNAILDVYDVFATICQKHSLRHYALGGTLLGAVRHKGFIPWDDDFDLAMPRQDYDKLKEVLKKELPPHLKFVDRHNTPEFRLLFGKIQDTRSSLVQTIEEKIGMKLLNGIFIDIFPIDGYPDSWLGALNAKMRERIYNSLGCRLLKQSIGEVESMRGRVKYFLGGVVSLFRKDIADYDDFLEWSERYLTSITFDDNHNSGVGGVNVGVFQMVFPPQLFGQGTLLEFCGNQVPAPVNWQECLKINFGDYAKLPPEDQRKPKHSWGERRPWCYGPTKDI